MLKKNVKLSEEHLHHSPEADLEIIKAAMLELQTFAHMNLMELSQMEKRSTGTSSSIDMFCQVDLGIMESDDGKLNYFVNEVERGPNVCLWAGTRWPYVIGNVASKLGPVLHSWIKSHL
jgi:predicted Mrr-cat superfamily restriction endonuclease